MANSIQTVGNRVELFDDLDLLLVLRLILDQLESDESKPEAAQRCIERWRDAVRVSGPGTIDLHLEELLAYADATHTLTRVLNNVQVRLSRFDDPIPAEVLNAKYQVPGVRFYDFPVQRILKVLDKLRHLIGVTEG